jgi:1,4-dihydroxy-2-naphthoate octaprenyltransferase
MATQFATLKKNDPNFVKYLWGQFSVDEIAIPIKSYNLGTPEESVTFEIQKNTAIEKPNFIILLASLVKVRSFIILLFPIMYILLMNFRKLSFDLLSFGFAMASSVLLFAGLNVRNDVHDHVSGYDRVNIDSNTKPIRLGWMTAKVASQISLVLVFAAGVLSAPTILLNPEVAWVILFSLGLFLIGRFAKNNSYKNQHFGELVLFMLAGPCLAVGFQLAAGAEIDLQVLLFGVLWGLAVLFIIQLNNFSHIMTSSQNGIRNTITKLGFDLAPKFLVFCWVVFLGVWMLHQFLFFNNVWGAVSCLLLAALSAWFFVKILNIKSPMGSGLNKARRSGYYLFLTTVALLLLQITFAKLI